MTHDLLMGEFLYDPVKPAAGPRLQIAVTRKGPGFHAEITVYDEAGEVAWVEEMDDRARCMPLMRSAVLAAYLAADDVLHKDAPIALPAEPPTPPPAPASPPAPPLAPAAPPIPPPVRVSRPPVPAALPAPNPA